MGAGIAQISAAAGYKTIVREVEDSLVKKGLARIDKFLAGGVEKGKVTPQDKERTLGNLTGTTKLEDLAACDIIVEAIIENVDDKAKVYSALDAIVGEQTIYCSNTSSLCITELASKTKRPDRFAGLHFFNPVPIMILRAPAGGDWCGEAALQCLLRLLLVLLRDQRLGEEVQRCSAVRVVGERFAQVFL